MRVLFATAEVYPLIKTGGLADVSGALPPALESLGLEVRVLVPGYPAVMEKISNVRPLWALPDLPGGHEGRLFEADAPGGLHVFVINAPTLYERLGNPYMSPNGTDWPDNAERFAALGDVAARLSLAADSPWRPDILHCHDWHAGLAPAYLSLSGRPRPGTVMTIHNIAYQGVFAPQTLPLLRLPSHSFSMNGVEFYGQISFLKAGLFYADRVTTVSPTYAREIQTQAEGWGLDGLLSGRAATLSGILNGIDPEVWDPATDDYIAHHYSAHNLDDKSLNKLALQRELGLAQTPDAMLCAVVSRFTPQKGIDTVLAAAADLVTMGVQLIVLGSGDHWLEDGLRALAARHPGAVGVHIGYSESLSHRIQAGADALLVPSRFEPCGLTQLYAERYGTIPIVRPVGGLADTVVNTTLDSEADGTATGFWIDAQTPSALFTAVGQAMTVWHDTYRWQRLQRIGMAKDVGWRRAAENYRALYDDLLGQSH